MHYNCVLINSPLISYDLVTTDIVLVFRFLMSIDSWKCWVEGQAQFEKNRLPICLCCISAKSAAWGMKGWVTVTKRVEPLWSFRNQHSNWGWEAWNDDHIAFADLGNYTTLTTNNKIFFPAPNGTAQRALCNIGPSVWCQSEQNQKICGVYNTTVGRLPDLCVSCPYIGRIMVVWTSIEGVQQS